MDQIIKEKPLYYCTVLAVCFPYPIIRSIIKNGQSISEVQWGINKKRLKSQMRTNLKQGLTGLKQGSNN